MTKVKLYRQKYVSTALSDHYWQWLFWFSVPGRVPFPRYCFQTHIYNYFPEHIQTWHWCNIPRLKSVFFCLQQRKENAYSVTAKSVFCFSKQETKLCSENVTSSCIKIVGKKLGTLPVMILVFSQANALKAEAFLTRRRSWFALYCSSTERSKRSNSTTCWSHTDQMTPRLHKQMQQNKRCSWGKWQAAVPFAA